MKHRPIEGANQQGREPLTRSLRPNRHAQTNVGPEFNRLTRPDLAYSGPIMAPREQHERIRRSGERLDADRVAPARSIELNMPDRLIARTRDHCRKIDRSTQCYRL